MFYTNEMTSRQERESRKRVTQYQKWVKLCLVPFGAKDARIKTAKKSFKQKKNLFTSGNVCPTQVVWASLLFILKARHYILVLKYIT